MTYATTWEQGWLWSSRYDGADAFLDRDQLIVRPLMAHSIFRRTCAEYNIPLDYTFWYDWSRIFKTVLLAQIKESAVRGIPFEIALSLVTNGLPLGPGRKLDRSENIAYWKRQLPTRTETSGVIEFQHDESFSHKLFISSTFCSGKYNLDSNVALIAWMLGDFSKHRSNYNHFWQARPDIYCNNGLDDYEPYLISTEKRFLDVNSDALWLYSKNLPIETILP